MASIRLPVLSGGKANIRLVYFDDPNSQVIGFDGNEWATDYRVFDLSTEQTVELIPNSDIVTIDGKETGYFIRVAASGGRKWEYIFQVIDSEDVQEIGAIVNSDRVSPESMRYIFLGGVQIEIVDSHPNPYVPGVLYFSRT